MLETIGKYKLLREIGKGSFGTVYKAEHIELKQFRALKVLHEDEFIRQFRKEGLIHAKLDHPNIVKVFDMDAHHERPYIAMEYVKGKNLAKHLKRHKRFSVPKALGIMEQSLNALSYAHDYEVIHRDIKPTNILLDQQGNVKIADFGLGKIVEKVSISHSLMSSTGDKFVGTIKYMSPEQKEALEITQQSDIYSLGLVFYEILTGKFPAGVRVAKPSELNSKIPESLDEIIFKCLEADLEDRYEDAEEVLNDLKEMDLNSKKKKISVFKPETKKEITKNKAEELYKNICDIIERRGHADVLLDEEIEEINRLKKQLSKEDKDFQYISDVEEMILDKKEWDLTRVREFVKYPPIHHHIGFEGGKKEAKEWKEYIMQIEYELKKHKNTAEAYGEYKLASKLDDIITDQGISELEIDLRAERTSILRGYGVRSLLYSLVTGGLLSIAFYIDKPYVLASAITGCIAGALIGKISKRSFLQQTTVASAATLAGIIGGYVASGTDVFYDPIYKFIIKPFDSASEAEMFSQVLNHIAWGAIFAIPTALTKKIIHYVKHDDTLIGGLSDEEILYDL